MRNKATRNWWYQIQSFKCCLLRCYFGCDELVPCARTVVLVILRYQKVPWAKRYRYRQKLYRGTAIIPRYRTTLLRCLSAKAGSHSNEQYCHLLAVVTSRSRSLQRISVFFSIFSRKFGTIFRTISRNNISIKSLIRSDTFTRLNFYKF